MMNNDMSNPTNHDARISCEETFTEDMGPATWANEPTQPTEPTSEITRTAYEIKNDIWPADCPPWDPRREITLEKEGDQQSNPNE